MFDQWIIDRTQEYLAKKAADARQDLYRRNPKLGDFPDEAMKSPEHLIWWIMANVPYTGDGARIMYDWNQKKWIGCGVPDTYLHPREILFHVEHGSAQELPIDCDDVMCLIRLGIAIMHFEGRSLPVNMPICYTLVAGLPHWQLNLPPLYWPTHNVCAFYRPDGQTGKLRFGVGDTNGLHWFDHPNEAWQWFGGLYRTQYLAVPTPYPFYN